MTTYTGQYGFVLLPEQRLQQESCAISASIGNNSISLGRTHEPHLTLYHTKVCDVPEVFVDRLLHEIGMQLPISVSFTTVTSFGEKFMFWNARCSADLLKLHQHTLQLSKYFHASGIQQTDTEKVTLSTKELCNVKYFGHPLVHDMWQPHITVGYVPTGVNMYSRKHIMDGFCNSVAFVEVGSYGTIARIIKCSAAKTANKIDIRVMLWYFWDRP